MTASDGLYETSIRSLKLSNRGKVRDIYDIDEKTLLIVTTDRVSAFDVILPDPIPGKGRVLTDLSNFWFKRFDHIIPNHLVDIPLAQVVPDQAERELIEQRSIVVRKLNPLPVEAIVRGFLIGSGWADYCKTQSVCGIELPSGLRKAEKLPQSIYTPSTKASIGDHDENISFAKTVDLMGRKTAERIRDLSLNLYAEAAKYAMARGIIIADTKFEFGLADDGTLYLIDEILTPDSSRFWPLDQYQVGTSPPSFDKQFIRDYLESLGWDKTPPGPRLPEDILRKSADKYTEAETRLTSDAEYGVIDEQE